MNDSGFFEHERARGFALAFAILLSSGACGGTGGGTGGGAGGGAGGGTGGGGGQRVDGGWVEDGGVDAGPPSFTLSLGEESFTILGGLDHDLDVAIDRLGSFTGAVTVTASPLPTGVTVAPLVIGAAATHGVLTFTADVDTPQSNVDVVVLGTSGALTDMKDVSVMALHYPEITISFDPDPVLVPVTGMNTLTATFVRSAYYSGPVEVTFSGIPTGVTVTPNPLIIGTGDSAAGVSIAADATATEATTSMTLTTVIPARERVDQVELTVAPLPAFTASLDPTTLYVEQGSSADVTIDVVRDMGFMDALTVSSSPDPAGVTTAGANIATNSSTTTLTYEATTSARLIVPTEVSVEVGNGSTVRAETLSIVGLPETPNHLDGSFGTGGLVLQKNYSFDYFMSVIVDGSTIVVGGQGGRVYRFADDGTLDATFGTAGVVEIPANVLWTKASLDPSGRYVFCGQDATTGEAMVLRLLTDGTLDPAFGAGDIVRLDFGGAISDFGGCITLADGSVIVAGAADGADQDFAVAKLTPSGALDATFGVVTGDLGGEERAYGLATDGSNIFVAGVHDVGPGSDDAFVAKLDEEGGFVTAFDGDGMVLVTEGNFGIAVGVLADGSIALLASGYPESVQARLSAVDGSRVADFGTNGVVLFNVGTGSANWNCPVIGDDGSVVMAGDIDGELGVIRLGADGVPDATFGNGGWTSTTLGDTAHLAAYLAIDTGGDYVVVGYSDTHGVIARYLH